MPTRLTQLGANVTQSLPNNARLTQLGANVTIPNVPAGEDPALVGTDPGQGWPRGGVAPNATSNAGQLQGTGISPTPPDAAHPWLKWNSTTGEWEASAAPSSGGAPTSPPSNTTGYVECDSGVTKDGSNFVSQLTDLTGHGHHFANAHSGTQPLWVAAAANDVSGSPAYFNGLPFVRYDGVDDFLQRVLASAYNAIPFSAIWCVRRLTITGNSGFGALTRPGVSDADVSCAVLGYDINGSVGHYVYRGGATTQSNHPGVDPFIFSAVFDGTRTLTQRINGIPVTFDGATTALNFTQITIGSRNPNSSTVTPGNPSNYEMAAFGFLLGAWSARETRQWERYLAGKYDISIAK